ncbi:DNA polymerase family B-domain-containing protein [Dichotomocladium elegans]|nr:DNA polymerase family B-domain-containing protein [Dichotomocladium elegans]
MKIKEERPDLQAWEKAEAILGGEDTYVDTRQDASLDNIVEEDGSLHFWWYDAFERREKGTIYLFGKVYNRMLDSYMSCCVVVANVERTLFVLPRQYKLDGSVKQACNTTEEEVQIVDVQREFQTICNKQKISTFKSKPVMRKYAFELPDVPPESEYLKVHYSYQAPALPEDLKGMTFSHVFGANTGPLEHFLVKRDIMGPCWLKVKNAKVANTMGTWCKIEIAVDDPKAVNPLRDENGNLPDHVPPLVVLSISLRTIMNHKKTENEIVAASGLVFTNVNINDPTPIDKLEKQRFAVVRQLGQAPFPAGFLDAIEAERRHGLRINTERLESALLNYLIAKIGLVDPDVIVGHNFAGFDLDVLLHRMKKLGTQNWHKLGRFRRSHWPKLQSGPGGGGESTYQERMIMSGRLVCDTYLTSKDLIRSKSYRLTDLAQSQLKIAREDIEFDKVSQYFDDAKSLVHLVKHCAFDAYLSTALMFKLQVLPLTKQLTNLAGNMWARSMTGARAERNEFLLLHEFHRQKFICPDKTFAKVPQAVLEDADMDHDEANEERQTSKSKGSRRKPAYTGGLVLEPKKGFYDKYVLLLDFNSLYPSIIQEYNVCFTTVQRHKALRDGNQRKEDNEEDSMPEVPDSSVPRGLLPRLLKNLVDRRRQVKSLMKDPKISEAERMQYDIRQMALKLTANSMYGCLGFTHSRFYAKPLAMLITHKGREILQNTVDLASNMDLNVIYGDTDSIMVYTNENDIQRVKEIGNMLKRRVNELYNLLEIDIDGLFKHMLLLKKKKYAALLVQEKADGTLVESMETKGLDLVRRDWCDLSHDISSRVLSFILSDKDREEVVELIHEYLREVGEEIRQNKVSLEKFIINKQLTKNPNEYADAKSQPHVQVALRMREAGQNVRSGDTIPYVICRVDHIPNGSKVNAAEKAFHPDDVARGKMSLAASLDIDWYLNQQVHPPIARLCSPIEGTDIARLAECLGLDGSKYCNIRSYGTEEAEEEFKTLESQIGDKERFKASERLVILCNQCKAQQDFEGIIRHVSAEGDEKQFASGMECAFCQGVFNAGMIRNAMIRSIRSYIRRYYEGWMVCDDTTCMNRTRMTSVFGRRCLREGCHGSMNREYTDKQLYTQLLFFSTILDPVKVKMNAEEGTDLQGK